MVGHDAHQAVRPNHSTAQYSSQHLTLRWTEITATASPCSHDSEQLSTQTESGSTPLKTFRWWNWIVDSFASFTAWGYAGRLFIRRFSKYSGAATFHELGVRRVLLQMWDSEHQTLGLELISVLVVKARPHRRTIGLNPRLHFKAKLLSHQFQMLSADWMALSKVKFRKSYVLPRLLRNLRTNR